MSLTTNTQLRARVFAPDLDPGLETSQVYLCLGADLESFSSNAGYYTGFIGKWGVNATSRDYLVQCAREFDFWSGSDLDQTAYWHERTCNYLTNNGTTDRSHSFCSCPPEGRRNDGCGTNGPNPALRDPVQAETEFVPAKIRSFLDQRELSKPFCLSVSLKAPHAPWEGLRVAIRAGL